MPDLTQLLDAAAAGDRKAASELLPLVYDELRKLAAARMNAESPGHTLQPTALVHEAYIRLVGAGSVSDGPVPVAHASGSDKRFDNRGHFFAAAAEAMRRILVESARRKARVRHGGEQSRVPLRDDLVAHPEEVENVIAVSEALDQLAATDTQAAELVKLHYFAGLTIDQAAQVLGVSVRKAYSIWAYARAWLFRSLGGALTATE